MAGRMPKAGAWKMKGEISLGMIVVIMTSLALLLALAIGPIYGVWSRELNGQAELKEAEWNRQIAVEEAKAKLEASKSLAEAEIERAKGVAEANKIIGESLKENEQYLRYLWISEIASTDKDKTIVYIPTEANIPILEAGRI